MIDQYSDAREFFAAVRDAAIEEGRTKRTLERMRAREGVHAQGYEAGCSGSHTDVTGMAPVDARLDYEALTSAQVEEDQALIERAGLVLYGYHGRSGGISSLAGVAVADCMWWRYCAAESWVAVAIIMGYSERQCRRLVSVGFDCLDCYGIDACIEGVGSAVD